MESDQKKEKKTFTEHANHDFGPEGPVKHMNHLRLGQKCLETGKITNSLEYAMCLETNSLKY